jgi:hypothetical protein
MIIMTIYKTKTEAELAFWETAAEWSQTSWWRLLLRRKLAERALNIAIHNNLL